MLIEAETYRLGPHTTADDPTKYRDDEELQQRLNADPLIRLEKYLRENGHADDSFFEKLAEEAQELANGVREAAIASEPYEFDRFFDRAYAEEHLQVEEEREFYRNYVAGFEED